MPLSSMVLKLQQSTLTEELIVRAQRPNRLLMKGGGRAARALITSSIAKKRDKPLLIIVPTIEEASRWFSLLQLMGWDITHLYPSSEGSPYDSFDLTSEIIWGQLQVLSDLISDKPKPGMAIVASERSLQPHLPPRDILKRHCCLLKKGIEINLEELSINLSKLGYTRLSTIEQEGTWSRRGDIVDIYPVSSELPVRLEFFGNELDKLREFDPSTQKSLDPIEEINLTPTSFNPLIAEKLRESIPEVLEFLLEEDSLSKLLDNQIPEGMRRLIGLAWNRPSSILDYIDKETCVVIDERNQGIAHCKQWVEHAQENFNEVTASINNKTNVSSIIYPDSLHRKPQDTFKDAESFFGYDLSELNESSHQDNSFDLSVRTNKYSPNEFAKLSNEIKGYLRNKVDVWLLSAQPSRAVSLLQDHDCSVKFISNNSDYQAIIRTIEQNTPIALKSSHNTELEGLFLPAWQVALFTDKELFGQQSIGSAGYIRRRRVSASQTVNPNKMQAGDYVVHRNHGIGKFLRIEKHAFSGEIRDYLVVEYLDGKLSVAADQLGSLGRYRATDSKHPKINKMGGASWLKVKERAKKQVKKIAIDLVRLYAERSEAKGYAFPEDGPWQLELEDSFAFEPTADQQKAVMEVKRDMQRTTPMDRLVCGDVGFGKTEVAVRAIFKAITAGKQVALLAPTTVLAQQHWNTISERFAPYPIKVSILNRFRTNSERKIIMNELNSGKIDALIGTHQILSKNIEFKKLGLLVIDEEQRFGVKQKERIKLMKKDVDVLTLSATPIPRTLYMSLSGVREMSLIATPPPLRRPIKTHLSPIDDEIIRSAICQELDRGGANILCSTKN